MKKNSRGAQLTIGGSNFVAWISRSAADPSASLPVEFETTRVPVTFPPR
jgi:hypothetical protein